MELISRDKLKEVIEPMVGKFDDEGGFWWSRESILRAIDNAPTIEERKEGHNLKAEYSSLYECSECGWECWDTMSCDTITFNFCPNCGAKMERKDGEERPMKTSEITWIVPPNVFESLAEAYPELVKKEWDGSEVLAGVRLIKSEPVYENRAMRREKKKEKAY